MITSTATLSPTLVRQLIAAAVAAPSVHNTQPWLFRIDDDVIHLYGDVSRQLQAQDPDGRALLMSCGAALLNLRLAAEHFGRTSSTTIFPNDTDPFHIASIDLHGEASPSGMVDELFAAIPHRHTNRLPYDDRPFPPAVARRALRGREPRGRDLLPGHRSGERRRLVDLIHDADATTDPRGDGREPRSGRVSMTRGRTASPRSRSGPIPKSPATPHRDLAPGRVISGRGFAVFENDPTLAVLTTARDDRRHVGRRRAGPAAGPPGRHRRGTRCHLRQPAARGAAVPLAGARPRPADRLPADALPDRLRAGCPRDATTSVEDVIIEG